MQDSNMKTGALASFLWTLGHKDPGLSRDVQRLWTTSKEPHFAPKNIFERRSAEDIAALRRDLPEIVNSSKTLAWPEIGGHLTSSSYLPIRAFRGSPARIWPSVDNLRIFLSSGTTSGPEGRSQSAYSPEGARFYRAGSIATFLGVLETCVGPFCDNFLSTSILSLVPTVEEWPDSSLAQMVHWFSDIWPTRYLSPEKIDRLMKEIEDSHARLSPVIIFGTAFHFVHLLDHARAQGLVFSLPKGSIIIETGGTKGKSRSVTRSELYEMICRGFNIPESRIVSEYGMCELASQAWDFVPAGTELPLSERTFRFPWWVDLGVMTAPNVARGSGEGALTIDDPLRVDIGHTSLQTEDIAMLSSDGSFALLGRVPRAPLKGCSLKVEDVASQESLSVRSSSLDTGHMFTPDLADLRKNADKVLSWMNILLSDEKALAALTSEFQSETFAKCALEDIATGMPRDADSIIKASLRAAGIKKPEMISCDWLMIAPANHSLALIQPLAAAITLGLRMRIRLPEIAGIAGEKTFLARAVDLAIAAGHKIEKLGPSFRLGANELKDGERVLVFGDDTTCQVIREFAPGRVSTFGNAVSVTLAQGKDLKTDNDIDQLLKDQFSLAQRGCLSSRAVFLFEDGDTNKPSQIARRYLSCSLDTAPEIHLSPGELAARSMEDVRLQQAGFNLILSAHDANGKPRQNIHATIAWKKTNLETFSQDILSGIGRLDFVVPIFVLPEETPPDRVLEEIAKILALRASSLSPSIFAKLTETKKTGTLPQNLQMVALGSLGAPIFDGTHLGRPFFAETP